MRRLVALGCVLIFPSGRFALITAYRFAPAFSPTLLGAITYLMRQEPNTANSVTELISNDRDAELPLMCNEVSSYHAANLLYARGGDIESRFPMDITRGEVILSECRVQEHLPFAF